MENIIVIDIGNTTTEFAFMQDGKIMSKFYIFTNSCSLEDLDALFKKYRSLPFERSTCIIASVVPAYSGFIREYLTQKDNSVYIIKNTDFLNTLNIQADVIDNIGIDILCKSFWSFSFLKKSTLIVDVGTATVVQHTGFDGSIKGVSITIGLSSIYRFLKSSTALLPLIAPVKAHKSLGLDTKSCIEGGVYFGYIGTLKELILRAQAESKIDDVYLTGGLSGLIKDDLPASVMHHQNIIFESIYMFYKTIKKVS